MTNGWSMTKDLRVDKAAEQQENERTRGCCGAAFTPLPSLPERRGVEAWLAVCLCRRTRRPGVYATPMTARGRCIFQAILKWKRTRRRRKKHQALHERCTGTFKSLLAKLFHQRCICTCCSIWEAPICVTYTVGNKICKQDTNFQNSGIIQAPWRRWHGLPEDDRCVEKTKHRNSNKTKCSPLVQSHVRTKKGAHPQN